MTAVINLLFQVERLHNVEIWSFRRLFVGSKQLLHAPEIFRDVHRGHYAKSARKLQLE